MTDPEINTSHCQTWNWRMQKQNARKRCTSLLCLREHCPDGKKYTILSLPPARTHSLTTVPNEPWKGQMTSPLQGHCHFVVFVIPSKNLLIFPVLLPWHSFNYNTNNYNMISFICTSSCSTITLIFRCAITLICCCVITLIFCRAITLIFCKYNVC